MQFIAELAVALQPLALIAPALGPAYYCLRRGLTCIYLVCFTPPAATLGYLLSPSVQGHPDQPHTVIIPAVVFVAAIVGLGAQIARDDWIDDRTPRPTRHRRFK